MPLAPLDLGDVFGGVVRIWLRHWKIVVPVSAVIAIVTTAAGVPWTREWLLMSSDLPARPGQSFEQSLAHLRTAALLLPLLATAWALAAGVGAGVFAAIARRAVLGHPPAWAQVWGQLRPQLLRLVGLSLVVYLAAGAALLLCIVPGVILFVLWSLAIPALVTEGLTIRQALGRSYRLVVGDGWRVFGILALLTLASGVVAVILNMPATTAVQFSIDPGFDVSWGFVIASSAAGLLGGVVTMAVLPFTMFLLYADQRIRRERYDLQLAREAAAS